MFDTITDRFNGNVLSNIDNFTPQNILRGI